MTASDLGHTAVGLLVHGLFWKYMWLPRLRRRGVGWRRWSVPALVVAAGVLLRTKSWWAGEATVVLGVGMTVLLLRDDDGPGPRRKPAAEAPPEGPALHDGMSPQPA